MPTATCGSSSGDELGGLRSPRLRRVEDAAHRETSEELGITIELGPLVGVCSRAEDRVVLIVFRARALGRPRTTPEATEVRSFAEAEVPWDELAFWSTNQALRDAFGL
jgi:ADP-ribose pyrophosphatase YjhB (NUDIX family)